MAAMKAATGTAISAVLDFGVIDERARQLEISKQDLADRVGVDQSTIWRYRQGMVPALPIAEKIAEVLGLSMDEIRGRGNPTPPPPPGPSSPPPPPGPKPAR